MAAFLNISSFRKNSAFVGNRDGAALIEFAFIAPVLLLLIVGAMEYGIYFLNSMSSSRALSASTQLVMQDPTNPDNQTFANRDLAFGDHKVCAKAFATLAAAENGTCADGEWSTGTPAGHDDAYYVAMSASGEGKSITGLFSTFLPSIKHNEVVKVSTRSGPNEVGKCPKDHALLSTGNGDAECKRVYCRTKHEYVAEVNRWFHSPIDENGDGVNCTRHESRYKARKTNKGGPVCQNGEWKCVPVSNPFRD